MSRRSRGPGGGIGAAVSKRFRALDRRLHINQHGRSEWIWAIPIVGFLITFGLFVLQGQVIAGITPALYVPIGLLVAGVIGGMSVAYMAPEPDLGASDDGGSKPPPPDHDEPPDGWSRWLRTPSDRLPEEPPAPALEPREPVGSAGTR